MEEEQLIEIRSNLLSSISGDMLNEILGPASIMFVGRFGVTLYNLEADKVEYVSRDAKLLLGITDRELGSGRLSDFVYHEDKEKYNRNEKSIAEFFANLTSENNLKFKAAHDFRIKCKNDSLLHLYKQYIPVEYKAQFGVSRVLILYTDISHIKRSVNEGPSIISLNGAEVPESMAPRPIPVPVSGTTHPFSEREIEVMRLIAGNYNTEDIAARLFISKHTVRIHRKNLLRKSGAKSSLELVLMANDKGWI